jgi:hypothetical protein
MSSSSDIVVVVVGVGGAHRWWLKSTSKNPDLPSNLLSPASGRSQSTVRFVQDIQLNGILGIELYL